MKTRIIGLTGLAGSGKDLFFTLLSQKMNCKRYAFADELKREAYDFVKNQYGIDLLLCSREEKETIRPFLVTHGAIKRKQTDGRYWIDKITKTIDDSLLTDGGKTLYCVTDIRYNERERDEASWLKNEMKGKLVHISKFSTSFFGKKFIVPPNEEEARNDPSLKEISDYSLEWEHFQGGDKKVKEAAQRKVDDFITWINS